MPVESILVPGKVNLALKVIGRRPDGYHDIWSIIVPISIFDRVLLTLDFNGKGLSVECNFQDVPLDERNLAVRALRAYQGVAGWPSEDWGVRIGLEKNIPVGAGLGGGSADAAGLLMLLNRLNPYPLKDDVLKKVAASVGADVPFFLEGCPCIAEGIGDRLTPLSNIRAYSLVLIKPPFTVSTAWAYGSLELTEMGDFFMKKKVEGGELEVVEVLVNDLERVTIAKYPVLGDMKRWLMGKGAKGSLMSGSGPTVFGIFDDAETAFRIAEEARHFWGESYWIQRASILTEPVEA